MNNPYAPATKRQTWALFCITKQDYRGKGLTKRQASDLIGKLKVSGAGNADRDAKYRRSLAAAHRAGMAAGGQCSPVPMLVTQHEDPFDDTSETEESWYVPEGVCGFATIRVRCNTRENRRFVNALKRLGKAGDSVGEEWSKSDYYGGYCRWVREFGQSYEKKVAYAHAYVEEIEDSLGVTCRVDARLD